MIKYIWLMILFLPIHAAMELSDIDDKKIDDKKVDSKIDILPLPPIDSVSTDRAFAIVSPDHFAALKKVAKKINKGGKWLVTPLYKSPLVPIVSEDEIIERVRFDGKPIEKQMPLISQPRFWHTYTTPLNIALASYATVKLISRYGKPVIKSTFSLITKYPGVLMGMAGFVSLLSGVVLGQFYRAEYEGKNKELNAKMSRLEKEKAELEKQKALQPHPVVYFTQPTHEQMAEQYNREKDMEIRLQRAEQEKDHLLEREKAFHATVVKLGNDLLEIENKRRAQELADRTIKYDLEDKIAVSTRKFNALTQQFKDMAGMFAMEKECTSEMANVLQKQRREHIALLQTIKELKDQIETYKMQLSFVPVNVTSESADSLDNKVKDNHPAVDSFAITIPEMVENKTGIDAVQEQTKMSIDKKMEQRSESSAISFPWYARFLSMGTSVTNDDATMDQ